MKINLSPRHVTSLKQGLSSLALFGVGRSRTLRTRLLKSKEASMLCSFVTESVLLHDLKSKPSIDTQTCQAVNYSSNVADSSYCLWTSRNFPLLARREIQTRRLELRAQSLAFRLSPSLFSCFSPCSSLNVTRCALSARTLSRKGLSAVYGFRNTINCVRGCFPAFVTHASL